MAEATKKKSSSKAKTTPAHDAMEDIMDDDADILEEAGPSSESAMTSSVSDGLDEDKVDSDISDDEDLLEGIPEEELPYVFERFYKSDRSRGLDKTGTGLGLYISKTNVNMHGEELNVQSVYGEFCEFSFTLPLAQK